MLLGDTDMSKSEEARDDGPESKKTRIDNVDDVDSDNEDPTGGMGVCVSETGVSYMCETGVSCMSVAGMLCDRYVMS